MRERRKRRDCERRGWKFDECTDEPFLKDSSRNVRLLAAELFNLITNSFDDRAPRHGSSSVNTDMEFRKFVLLEYCDGRLCKFFLRLLGFDALGIRAFLQLRSFVVGNRNL